MVPLATSKISLFLLVSEAELSRLSLTMLETPRQVFLQQGPYCVYCVINYWTLITPEHRHCINTKI